MLLSSLTWHDTKWCPCTPLFFCPHILYPALFHHHLSTHAPIPLNQLLLLHLSVLLFHLVFPSLFVPPLCSTFLHSMQGIGRLILKEEMKARAGCHDNDQWGSRHSSRCSSKEALSNLGYSSLNGCKCVCVHVFIYILNMPVSWSTLFTMHCHMTVG